MFLGCIIDFVGDYAPHNWAFCHGQILNISDYPDLYAVIGNKFGGDVNAGTFALPDKRGRVAVCAGQGSGLSNYDLAATGGKEKVTLTIAEIPAHGHKVNADSTGGSSNDPTNRLLSHTGAFDNEYSSKTPDVEMSGAMIGNTGGGEGHDNVQPFLAVHAIICVRGAYPQRGSSC